MGWVYENGSWVWYDEDNESGSEDQSGGSLPSTPIDTGGLQDPSVTNPTFGEDYNYALDYYGLGGDSGSGAASNGSQSSGGGLWNLLKGLFGKNSGMTGASLLGGAAQSLIDRQSMKEAIAQKEKQDLRATALEESKLNPFRQQLAQGDAATRLDLAANAAYTKPTVAVPSAMQRFMPQSSGGFSYTRSPETTAGLAQLLRSVLSGTTAPTMTDSKNYGKTATLNLLAGAATGDPSSGTGAATGDPILGTPDDDRGEELLADSFGADTVDLEERRRRRALAGVQY